MKYTFGILALLFTATVALAGKTGDDSWQIGNPTSGVNKKLIWDTGDGSSNKYFLLDNSSKQLSTNVDQLTIGNGTAANQGIVFNRGGLNPVIRWNESNSVLEFTNDGTSYLNIGSGSGGGGGGLSILATNPDFEQSLALGWTASGLSFTAVVSGSNLLFGKQSALIDSSATGQSLKSDAYVIPKGLYGANCSAKVFYKGGDATYKLQALDGSDVVIAEQFFPGAATSTVPFQVTFPCPNSGSLKLAIASTANGAAMALDRMSIGEAGGFQVSQTQFVGSLTSPGASGCAWTTAVGAFSNFPATTQCSATPVVTGPLAYVGSKTPGFTVQNMSPGEYQVVVSGSIGNTGAAGFIGYRISDGTITSQGTSVYNTTGVEQAYGTYSFHLTVPTGGTRNFQLQCFSGSSTCLIQNQGAGAAGSQDLSFYVYRYPTTQEQAFRPDQVANSWSGYHDIDCNWSLASVTYGDPAIDASCTFTQLTNVNFGTVKSYDDGTLGNNLPGIVFTPSRPGTYHVCANVLGWNNAANRVGTFKLTDGVVEIAQGREDVGASTNATTIPVCGNYKATSTAPVTLKIQMAADAGSAQLGGAWGSSVLGRTISWELHQIDYALPAPLLVGGVVNDSSGVTNTVAFEYGVIGTSNCSTDPCTVSQTGSAITAVNRTSSGNYDVHFAAGTFSAPPVCQGNIQRVGEVMITPYQSSHATSTLYSFGTYNNVNALQDSSGSFICMGPK